MWSSGNLTYPRISRYSQDCFLSPLEPISPPTDSSAVPLASDTVWKLSEIKCSSTDCADFTARLRPQPKTIKWRERSVPNRGSVGWVSKCRQLLDHRDSPDATAIRYWPLSHCRSAYCPLKCPRIKTSLEKQEVVGLFHRFLLRKGHCIRPFYQRIREIDEICGLFMRFHRVSSGAGGIQKRVSLSLLIQPWSRRLCDPWRVWMLPERGWREKCGWLTAPRKLHRSKSCRLQRGNHRP